jgi:hypothetical protein
VPCGVLLFTAVCKIQLMYLEFKHGETEKACVSSHEEIHTAVCVCVCVCVFCAAAERRMLEVFILNEYTNVIEHHLRTR